MKRSAIQRHLELSKAQAVDLHSHLTQALALLVGGADADFLANLQAAKADLAALEKLVKGIR